MVCETQIYNFGVRLAGLEPTASAFAGLRSIHLSYKRIICFGIAKGSLGEPSYQLSNCLKPLAPFTDILLFSLYCHQAHYLPNERFSILSLRASSSDGMGTRS